MAKNKMNKTQAGTDVQQVRQQNAQSQQGQGQFGTEFASETNVQEVRQQNAQSAAQKNQQNQQQ
jgi:small acid-soluble spore protein E (minor gamma-type SASP)